MLSTLTCATMNMISTSRRDCTNITAVRHCSKLYYSVPYIYLSLSLLDIHRVIVFNGGDNSLYELEKNKHILVRA